MNIKQSNTFGRIGGIGFIIGLLGIAAVALLVQPEPTVRAACNTNYCVSIQYYTVCGATPLYVTLDKKDCDKCQRNNGRCKDGLPDTKCLDTDPVELNDWRTGRRVVQICNCNAGIRYAQAGAGLPNSDRLGPPFTRRICPGDRS